MLDAYAGEPCVCISICVRAQGREITCDTLEELERAIGCKIAPLPFYQDVAEFSPRQCLCPVDLKATAARAGMDFRQATEEEGYPLIDVIMQQRGKAPPRAA
jgi:hypothetical protein